MFKWNLLNSFYIVSEPVFSINWCTCSKSESCIFV